MTTREQEEEEGDLDSTFIRYFRDRSYSIEDPRPSYFQDKRSAAVDLVLEKINMADLKSKPRLPWEKDLDMDWETSCKKQIARLLVRYEKKWVHLSKYSKTPEYHVGEAIRIAAMFLLRLCPKNLLYLSPNSKTNETTPQLNLLWDKLTASQSQPASMEKAYEFILEHLAQDTHSYPYIIESDVSYMLLVYSNILKYPTLSPRPCYQDPTPLDSDWEDDHPLFNKIFEVVRSIVDSTTELKADDYTRLLMQAYMDPHAEYASTKYSLSSKLNVDISPYDFSEYSSTLNSVFGGLFMEVLSTVHAELACALPSVDTPFYDLNPRQKQVPSEITSLIYVAQFRRIALGYRFVNRNHLLWAIYECGLALPSQITDDIEFNAAEDTHPPYHIYLACRNFAEFLSEDIQLEIFIFVVIYSTDSGGFTWDKSKMKYMKSRYKKFLEDLEGAQRSTKRLKLVSGEYK